MYVKVNNLNDLDRDIGSSDLDDLDRGPWY